MSSRFKWFLSAFTLVLSGVISVYDNYVDAISKMASEGRKTELSEKPQTNAAVVAEEGEREGEEMTLDLGPKQDDGWEKVSEAADNGGNWNDFGTYVVMMLMVILVRESPAYVSMRCDSHLGLSSLEPCFLFFSFLT